MCDYITINPFRYFDQINVHLLEVNKFVWILLKIENENDEIFGTSLCSSPKLVPLTSRRQFDTCSSLFLQVVGVGHVPFRQFASV